MSKRGQGETCTYCKRMLLSVTHRSQLGATRDHVIPKSKGGKSTVWACNHCNQLKKDMEPDDWAAFMESYPEWWKNPLFEHIGAPRERRPAQPPPPPAPPIPYSDSIYILKHGKKAWKEKMAREAAEQRPEAVPVEYADPKAQAAFEGAYANRLHLLRCR